MKKEKELSLTREAKLNVDEKGIVRISFSSEEPYARWFGNEILDHTQGCVDLSRLNEIGVVLWNHNRDEVIGKIVRSWVEGGRGEAEISFDSDEQSEKIKQKVLSGTLKGVSVGYEVTQWEDVDEGERSLDGRFSGQCNIAKRWMPYEVSIVSIPADPTVGVERSADFNNEGESKMEKEEKNIDVKKEKEVEKKEMLNVNELQEKAVAAERERVTEISAMCRDFGIDANSFISEGISVDSCRAKILEELKTKKTPIANVKTLKDEQDKFREAAVDAMCMRSGSQLEKPAAGSKDLRKMSIKGLAAECLVREGVISEGEARRMDNDELYNTMCRQYFNPSAAFPAILDATIKKNIVQLYQSVPTTFQQWTSKGSVSDFKAVPDHNYIIGGGSFEKVPENGELTASKPTTELLPTRKIDTYGTQFSMSRQAFINDDIGFLSQVPGLYAAAAKRKINQQVYEMICGNSANIYDGKKLFCADHKNHQTTGAAPSLATINALMLKMQTQKDPFGEAINVTPRLLILPIGYAMTIDTILHSTSIKTSDNDWTGYNPLANKGLTYIEDATINALSGSSACPWFMVSDAMSAKSVQVDYLNGQEVPNIRRSEKAGQLGYVWDIFLDWGITVIDYRGIARNNGATIAI